MVPFVWLYFLDILKDTINCGRRLFLVKLLCPNRTNPLRGHLIFVTLIFSSTLNIVSTKKLLYPTNLGFHNLYVGVFNINF